MTPWNIVLASSNKHKLDEIQEVFKRLSKGLFSLKPITSYPKINFSDIVESGSTFHENALIKAKGFYEKLSPFLKQETLGVLADDSGLVVPALGNAPGVFSARYAQKGAENVTDEDNRKKLISELKKLREYKNQNESQNGQFLTKAHFKTSMVFYSARDRKKETIIEASGTLKGYVTTLEKGRFGFGYDSLFIPDDGKLTLAEISPQEKNAISHRAKALEKMTIKLCDFFSSLSVV